MDGWMVCWIDRLDRSMYWSMDQLIDRWIDGWFDRWIDVSMDVSMDGTIYRSMHWSMDRWIDGLMDKFDWRPCRKQRELERVCVWDREWGFLHCRWKVNNFRDIVDGLQRKCKRKSWFLFYSFLWTCQEAAKSKVLEIVYGAYAGALKGW